MIVRMRPATLATCNMFFTGNLAGCLQDPFSVACHTEPTFTDRASVRTSRFNYCKTDQTSDTRCVGYTTCNVSATFAPITCGTDFNPVRMMFCGVTANAFDPLCITNNLIDTNAQMAFCRITQNAFDGRCVVGWQMLRHNWRFVNCPPLTRLARIVAGGRLKRHGWSFV